MPFETFSVGDEVIVTDDRSGSKFIVKVLTGANVGSFHLTDQYGNVMCANISGRRVERAFHRSILTKVKK